MPISNRSKHGPMEKDRLQKLTRKLYFSRMRILLDNGFFGCLLLEMEFVLTSSLVNSTALASTDGEKIYFNPDMLENLDDDELDFIMMHEVMHIVLKHVQRAPADLGITDKLNIAQDIVVNSNIMFAKDGCRTEPEFRNLGAPRHKTPEGEEGCKYSVEEVYAMLRKERASGCRKASSSGGASNSSGISIDSHEKFGAIDSDAKSQAMLDKRILQACEYSARREELMKRRDGADSSFGDRGCGSVPAAVKRIANRLRRAKIDWRIALHDFLQKSISDCDWTFLRPDARYCDGDLLLPGFNLESNDNRIASKLLFMVDVSGSMTRKAVSICYGEILSAVRQFEGRMDGWLGWFDAEVKKIVKFSGASDLDGIEFTGGGGTDFKGIFKYVEKEMKDDFPTAVVILTDGFAEQPSKEEALGLPLLWVLTDKSSSDFKYGKVINLDDESSKRFVHYGDERLHALS
ncbi:MAG TPA: hypothetical protein DCO86_00810 [Spirochaetaceae bacterium]|nr:hypothetical protein [Spirochaetaceae bacterium]